MFEPGLFYNIQDTTKAKTEIFHDLLFTIWPVHTPILLYQMQRQTFERAQFKENGAGYPKNLITP